MDFLKLGEKLLRIADSLGEDCTCEACEGEGFVRGYRDAEGWHEGHECSQCGGSGSDLTCHSCSELFEKED